MHQSDKPSVLNVSTLTKHFALPGGGHVAAVSDIGFDIRQREIFTILGPSGCGKSTLLRCIAGLETPDHGDISMRDQCVFSSRQGIDIPPQKRAIGMVFQSYAIWPHMTVFENAAFPLRCHQSRRFAEAELQQKVMAALSKVEMDALADRQANKLSGGQQQRLALARAIVADASLVLLDEPLSNLDARLRRQMRLELKRLQQDLDISILFVTHDQEEALSMSDRIAVMDEGIIRQIGTPREIYFRPKNKFVAEFIGITNRIDAEWRVGTSGKAFLHTALGPWELGTVPAALRLDGICKDAPIELFIRPENIVVSKVASAAPGWPCRVSAIEFMGFRQQFTLQFDGGFLTAQADAAELFSMGDNVFIDILLPDDAGQSTDIQGACNRDGHR